MKALANIMKTRSPARLALAAAIEAHQRATREMDAAKGSREQARIIADAAEERLAEAQRRLAEAKEAQRQRMTDAARSGTVWTASPDATLRQARLDEAEAQDEAEAARAVLASFRQALEFESGYDGRPLDPVTLAAEKVEAAARALVSAEIDVPRMVREATAAFDDASAKRAALVHLVRLKLMPAEHSEFLRNEVGQGVVPYFTGHTLSGSCPGEYVLDVVWPQDYLHGRPHERAVAANVEAARWDAALVALAADPDAPLPRG